MVMSIVMMMAHQLLPLLLLSSVPKALASPPSPMQIPLQSSAQSSSDTHQQFPNYAPQLFNALHGSMRQWDSSLHHNGMSFFPASIPAHTLLYHGTHTADPVTGMEWLAFEIEHAEVFARSRGPGRRRPPPGGRPGDGGPGDGRGPPPRERERAWGSNGGEIAAEAEKEEEPQHGYLHTYRTTHPLTNLLYIDGMSAGKTSMGTLDSQDLGLLHETNLTLLPGFGDYNRAVALCALSPDIEGYIRMEAGFELILCNFSKGLDFVSAYQRPEDSERGGFGMGGLQGAEYARGVSMRYRGIDGGRVKVDYSRMVSAYFGERYRLNLTNPDVNRKELPRLQKAGDEEGLVKVKRDVLRLFREKGNEKRETVDWQGVTDMIITRYADRLAFLALNASSTTDMLAEVEFLLTHFIDYGKPNSTQALEKCVAHYLLPVSPTTEADFLIQDAIATVSREICSTLFGVQELLLGEEDEGEQGEKTLLAKASVEKLKKYLDWSVWLECGKCAADEVCYLAVWPWGSKEDHTNPGCVNIKEVGTRRGYWDWH